MKTTTDLFTDLVRALRSEGRVPALSLITDTEVAELIFNGLRVLSPDENAPAEAAEGLALRFQILARQLREREIVL